MMKKISQVDEILTVNQQDVRNEPVEPLVSDENILSDPDSVTKLKRLASLEVHEPANLDSSVYDTARSGSESSSSSDNEWEEPRSGQDSEKF